MSLRSEEKSKQTFQYGNKTIEYILIKSKRRKTCEVIVEKDEITIRAPFDKSLMEVESILNDKIKWISQKQKEIQSEKPEVVKPSFEDDSTLPYLGKNFKLKIIYIIEKTPMKFEFSNDLFYVYLSKRENKISENIRSLYNDWLIAKANQIFQEKVNQFSRIVGINPNRIVIKNLKNRWGSVTKNKTINLNVNLIKAPDDIINYIIIHELCHFKVKGHSYIFWNYLKHFVPDYEQKVEWLRVNSINLIT